MFTNVKELQDFILWAKKQKVAAFKIKEFQIEFSPVALIDEEPEVQSSAINTNQDLTDTVPQSEQDKQDEEDLYWST